MRIAISGSHRVGKSTLLDALSAALPGYATLAEPYHSLEEEGYEFSDPPSLEDFEAQLQRSINDFSEGEAKVVFDRCPADFLAYLATHEDADDLELDEWLPRARKAIETLDLILFVPIEARDRIAFSPSDDEGPARSDVDEKLREILLDNPFELAVEVLEVAGDPETRFRTALQRIRGASRR